MVEGEWIEQVAELNIDQETKDRFKNRALSKRLLDHALAAALGYAARGWPSVPVTGKRPSCGDAWQLQATSDPPQVEQLFRQNPHDGVGVVLGESAGIIDVECDNDQAEQTLLELFDGTIPTTPTFQSARGKHRLFRWTADLPEPTKAVFKIGQLEFRTGNGDKAAQTVFPPSNGRTWIVSPDDAAVAVISAAVIDRIKTKYAAKQKRDKPTTRGEHRQGESLDVAAWLLSRGATLLGTDTTPDGAARWFIECPGITSHKNENGVRDCCVTQEPSGRLGGSCFHQSCGMNSWQAISTTIGKPTRDDYPTTLAENNGRGTHQPHSAPPVTEGGGHSPSSPPRKPMLSVRDLIGGFHNMRKPIIYGLLRESETMNVIAGSKVGKSWLATNLAITVATRRKLFGRFDTAGGDVLIIDNELHPETSAYRIPAVADANSIPLDEYADHVFVMNLRGELVSLPELAITLDSIEPGRFKLIILDAFYRFLPPGVDENDNGAMAGLYNLLDCVAAKLKCAFVCIHHASKGSQSAKAVTDVGSGAGSMSRAADCHVVLRPHEESNVVVMEVATRSWPPPQPLCLRWEFPVFTPDDTLNPSLLRPDRPRRPARTETEKTPAEPAWTHQRFTQEFCAATPQTRDAILAKVADAGLSARSAERLFRMAEGAGLIHTWPNVKKRQPGYATVPPPSPDLGERVDSARAPPHPPNTKPQERRVGVGECVRVGKRKAKAFGNRD